jgi:hypothetical protein
MRLLEERHAIVDYFDLHPRSAENARAFEFTGKRSISFDPSL